VCQGSGIEGVAGTLLPHSSFGDPGCRGWLNSVIRGDQADIVCNECEAVVRTVPAGRLNQTLAEMELTLDIGSAVCPHCGAVNLFPGFTGMKAYICRECGEGVALETQVQ